MITIRQSTPTLEEFARYDLPMSVDSTCLISSDVLRFHIGSGGGYWAADMNLRSKVLRVFSPNLVDNFLDWARLASEATGEDITVDIVKYDDDPPRFSFAVEGGPLKNLLNAVQSCPTSAEQKTTAVTLVEWAEFLTRRLPYGDEITIVLWLRKVSDALSLVERAKKNNES